MRRVHGSWGGAAEGRGPGQARLRRWQGRWHEADLATPGERGGQRPGEKVFFVRKRKIVGQGFNRARWSDMWGGAHWMCGNWVLGDAGTEVYGPFGWKVQSERALKQPPLCCNEALREHRNHCKSTCTESQIFHMSLTPSVLPREFPRSASHCHSPPRGRCFARRRNGHSDVRFVRSNCTCAKHFVLPAEKRLHG